MDLHAELRRVENEVRKVFPFQDYVTEAVHYEMHAIVHALRKHLPRSEGKRLLDIGSGPMDKTGIFRMLGFACYAVDDLNDPWHLRDDNQARIKRYAEDIGVVFHHQNPGDHSIPFEIGSFDVVCSLSVIEHLPESPRGLVNAMGTFAQTGGLLVIAMPNSVNLRKRLSVLMGRTNYESVDTFFRCVGPWRGHVREYTLAETEFICRASGFEVLSCTTFEHLAHEKLPMPLRQLYILLGNMVPTFRSGLLVICRKPDSWEPVREDPESYRRSLTRGVPNGVA